MNYSTETNGIALSTAFNYKSIYESVLNQNVNNIITQIVANQALNTNALVTQNVIARVVWDTNSLLSQRISEFYNSYPRTINFSGEIAYRFIPFLLANGNLGNSSFIPNDYHEYFGSKSYEKEAKRLQKFIKGTLLEMIEKIKASLHLKEIMNLRTKVYRIMSISRNMFSLRFADDTLDSKKFLLFEPQSNEEIKITPKIFLCDKSVQTNTTFQILNTIAA